MYSTADSKYQMIDWAGAEKCSAGCVLEKVSISAGRYISISGSLAKGIREKPIFLELPAYRVHINYARQMDFVLYDTASHRGWLVDGASALLHIARTQVVSSPFGDDPSLFDIAKFHYPNTEGDPDAAKKALLDLANQKLLILKESKSFSQEETIDTDEGPGEMNKPTKDWYFKDLVTQTWQVLEHIHDRQVDTSSAIVEVKPPHQHKLEGFEFMDIVNAKPVLKPRFLNLRSNGVAWLKFIRQIDAVVLFGENFGDLYQPAKAANTLCNVWKNVPQGQEYLVAPISLLKEVKEQRRREGDQNKGPAEIAKGFSWSASAHAFAACQAHSREWDQKPTHAIVQKFTSKINSECCISEADVFKEIQGAILIGKDSTLDLAKLDPATAGDTLSKARRSENSCWGNFAPGICHDG
ncbi:hypothetical protein SLS56_004200 [Neofusicoccum ribis]|uniref:Uncharacterized protein n=1 Tax=Neofusicoccum ribis TaxID=45134 RepID=A0ABR3SWV5_9PEZI